MADDTEQQHLARNVDSRGRLRQLIERDSADGLPRQSRGQIGTTLAHLAFWDRFVEARWRRAADEDLEAPPEIDDVLAELINDAGFPQWRMIPFEDAAGDAIGVSESLDDLIERIDPEVAARLIATGRARLVDRSIHRNEHIADLADASVGGEQTPPGRAPSR